MFEGKISNDITEEDYDDTEVFALAGEEEYDDVTSTGVVLKSAYQVREPIEQTDTPSSYHPDFNLSTSESSVNSDKEDDEDEDQNEDVELSEIEGDTLKLSNSYSTFYGAKTGSQSSRSGTPRSNISDVPKLQSKNQSNQNGTKVQSSTPKLTPKNANQKEKDDSSSQLDKDVDTKQAPGNEPRKKSSTKLTRIPFSANSEEYKAAMIGNPKVVQRRKSSQKGRKVIPNDSDTSGPPPIPEKQANDVGKVSSLRKRQAPLPPNGVTSKGGEEINDALGDLDDALQGMSGKPRVIMIAKRYPCITYI